MKQTNKICITALADTPSMIPAAAAWFHSKWGVAALAYTESMEEAVRSSTGVPAWYVVLDEEGEIIAGAGVIANDFHKRVDLTPNICALFVEEAYRRQGLAKALLKHACAELAGNAIPDVYLVTSHTGLYERYGWEFLCMAEEDGGEMIRMYHRTTFHEMRRKDRQLADEEAVCILEKGTYGILATIGEDGYPYGVPMSYAYENGVIYFHGADTGHKLENLESHNQVSFTVVGDTRTLPEEFSTEYESVIAFGRIVPSADKTGALSKIVKKYSPGYEEKGRKYAEVSGGKTAVLELHIAHMSGKARKRKQ